MKTVEKQKEMVSELLQLIKENPELRIVPMVDTEAVGGDEFGWWLSRWGKASVEAIYSHDERCYIRSEDEDSLIEDLCESMEVEGLTDDEIYKLA